MKKKIRGMRSLHGVQEPGAVLGIEEGIRKETRDDALLCIDGHEAGVYGTAEELERGWGEEIQG